MIHGQSREGAPDASRMAVAVVEMTPITRSAIGLRS
jgi:hypothetical protein